MNDKITLRHLQSTIDKLKTTLDAEIVFRLITKYSQLTNIEFKSQHYLITRQKIFIHFNTVYLNKKLESLYFITTCLDKRFGDVFYYRVYFKTKRAALHYIKKETKRGVIAKIKIIV